MVLVPDAFDHADDPTPAMTADPLHELHAHRIRPAHQRRPKRRAHYGNYREQHEEQRAAHAAPHLQSRYDLDAVTMFALAAGRSTRIRIDPVVGGWHVSHDIAVRPCDRVAVFSSSQSRDGSVKGSSRDRWESDLPFGPIERVFDIAVLVAGSAHRPARSGLNGVVGECDHLLRLRIAPARRCRRWRS